MEYLIYSPSVDTTPNHRQVILNDLSSKGWDLVAVVYNPAYNTMEYTFRRMRTY